jgi:hypothetical protein
MVETPREFARVPIKELEKLLARLRAGDALSELDLETAAARAEEARRRSVAAHIKAAQRFLRAAEVHERAAELYEAQAADRRGSGHACLRASDNRAAASRARTAADAEICRAMEAAGRTA